MLKTLLYNLVLCVLFVVCSGCGSVTDDSTEDTGDAADRVSLLQNTETWMYQIQELEEDGAVEALAESEYDMLVVEPTYTNQGSEDFDVEGMVDQLHKKPDGSYRLVIAYIDIGEAEDYRTYWEDNWVAPTETQRGSPDFLITIDPDGWSGNYPVAYWDSQWQDLWLGDSGMVAELANQGFDGVYLDWVEAYDNEQVGEAAEEEDINTADAMVNFISEISSAGKDITSDFLVIAQNAPYLIDTTNENYSTVIDALAVEDTWYRGEGDAEWDDQNAGDIANDDDDEFSTESRLEQYNKYLSQGLPVFSVDYCISEGNAEQVYQDASEAGLIPLVTRVSLSRLTETPPPSLE